MGRYRGRSYRLYRAKKASKGELGPIGWFLVMGVGLSIVAWIVEQMVRLSLWIYAHHQTQVLLGTGFLAGLLIAYLVHKTASWLRVGRAPTSTSAPQHDNDHPYFEVSLDNLATEKSPNSRGYIVLVKKHLEHRYLAEQALNRKLTDQECVHHINGRRDDNTLTNLCVIDKTKHELFHSWLRWKKEKSGYYPSRVEIEKTLEQEYGGQLLSPLTKSIPRKNLPQIIPSPAGG